TTTSGLTAGVLRAARLRVWRNREGANLLRGIAAALIIRARPSGRLRWHGNAAAVFEVDEAAFAAVVAAVRPHVVAVTNLFRDQLDRYGEVDTVAERWRAALRRLPAGTTLVLNADDPAVAALGEGIAGRVVYFGVASAAVSEPSQVGEVVDTRTCPRCGAVLDFAPRFFSHVGHWACHSCGYARPAPAVEARDVRLDGLDDTRFTLATPGTPGTPGTQDAQESPDAPKAMRAVRLPLPGLYNVYNALAAAAISCALDVSPAALDALERFAPAFGRAERITVDGRTVQLLLAKNPTGLNEVLRTLAGTAGSAREGAGDERRHLLLALNDHAADGEDVSWIWDAGIERLAGIAGDVTVTGTRAYDLALRLKYAGIAPARVEPDPAVALREALAATPEGETLYAVPTYTAMLELRAALERAGYVPHYWE
ncbi:MAG TPA: MurT ligase domain-containing protein, partial [Ktedonobacterales bacterium]|nr:MurT ligase domain-containing protein [Ktedonobacterales bacterium]